nr:MBL fold metallo-hydrolase [Flexivirga oryzae]
MSAGARYVPGRSGPASLVTVGKRTFLVDAGPGTVRRLGQAGVSVDRLAGVFVTHAHSDHIADLFAMFLLSNPGGTMGEFTTPVPIFGPGPSEELPTTYDGKRVPIINRERPAPGIAEFLELQQQAFRYDINVRNVEQSPTAVDYPALFDVREIRVPPACRASPTNPAPRMSPFVVLDDEEVTVSATLVAHAPVFPSFAFRFDTPGGSVTFSGDTGESANLVELARGTDLLVHEVVDVDHYARTSGGSASVIDFMRRSHTTPEGVGRVAASGARSVVLSHLLPGDPGEVTPEQWCARVASEYDGPVSVGEDLATYEVGTA